MGDALSVVLGKLRAGGASIVEVLPPEIVMDIVGTLFPSDGSSSGTAVPFVWRDDLAVTIEEVLEAGLKVKSGKAPGPDVARIVVKDTMRCLARLWAGCFTSCLRKGHFPRDWKGARLAH